jgi:hypothetical protein
MRYNYEFFTEIILKDGFIILLCNMNALYPSDLSKEIWIWVSCGIYWNLHVNTPLLQIH